MDETINVPDEQEKEKEAESHRSTTDLYFQQFQAAVASLTIRGLSRAIKSSKRKYRVYWTFTFVIAFAIFCASARKIAACFLEEPILTQFEREDRPFVWPHFTFCNPANPIPFWTDPKLKPLWKRAKKKAEDEYNSLPRYDLARHKKIWEHYIGISSIDPRKLYSQVLRGSIFGVSVVYEDSTIAGYSSSIDLFRSVRNFSRVFDVRLQTIRSPIACISLVTERLRDVVKELKAASQRLTSIKLYLIMDAAGYMTFDMGFESRKMYFFVTRPNASITSLSPFYLQPGTDSTFSLRQRVLSRVAHCTSSTFNFSLYDVEMRSSRALHGGFNDCRLFVSQREFVRRCGCYNPYLPVFKLPRQTPVLCTNMTLFDTATMSNNIRCLNAALKEKHSFRKVVRDTCDVFLQNPCVESSYSVSRYTSTWRDTMSPTRRSNTRAASRGLPNAPSDATEAFPKDNLAILKLEWSGQKTEATFEQFAYPASRFMSDLGALFVWWLGLNVFNVFELLEVVYKFVKYRKAKARAKQTMI